MSKDYINQKFKATIFEMIFRETEAALSLYNAINDTNYTDASQLEITTLNNALYMGMKNDVSFIIDFVMNLYEHQSTYNPNMPLRGLFYFARLYEAYIKEKDWIYSHPPESHCQARSILYSTMANGTFRKKLYCI